MKSSLGVNDTCYSHGISNFSDLNFVIVKFQCTSL